MSTCLSSRSSSSVSGVSGAWRNARPEKMTRPMRSPSRRRTKSASTRRATWSRLPGWKSPDFMLLEISSAIIRFRDLMRMSSTCCGVCGRASAVTRSTTPSSRSALGSQGQRVRGVAGAPARNRSAGNSIRSARGPPPRPPPPPQLEERQRKQREDPGLSQSHRRFREGAGRRGAPAREQRPTRHRGMREPAVGRRPGLRELHQVGVGQQRRQPLAISLAPRDGAAATGAARRWCARVPGRSRRRRGSRGRRRRRRAGRVGRARRAGRGRGRMGRAGRAGGLGGQDGSAARRRRRRARAARAARHGEHRRARDADRQPVYPADRCQILEVLERRIAERRHRRDLDLARLALDRSPQVRGHPQERDLERGELPGAGPVEGHRRRRPRALGGSRRVSFCTSRIRTPSGSSPVGAGNGVGDQVALVQIHAETQRDRVADGRTDAGRRDAEAVAEVLLGARRTGHDERQAGENPMHRVTLDRRTAGKPVAHLPTGGAGQGSAHLESRSRLHANPPRLSSRALACRRFSRSAAQDHAHDHAYAGAAAREARTGGLPGRLRQRRASRKLSGRWRCCTRSGTRRRNRRSAKSPRRTPRCAMGHWGQAMSVLHPLWTPPDTGRGGAGTRGGGARRAGLPPGTRQRDYADAIATFWRGYDGAAAFRARLTAYEGAMERLVRRHPADAEAQGVLRAGAHRRGPARRGRHDLRAPAEGRRHPGAAARGGTRTTPGSPTT